MNHAFRDRQMRKYARDTEAGADGHRLFCIHRPSDCGEVLLYLWK